MALMILSVVLALSSLFLPWFEYNRVWTTDSGTDGTDYYTIYRNFLVFDGRDGTTLEVYYEDDSDMKYMMNVIGVLMVLWAVLGLGFVYSILRDDAALGILTGTLIAFIGGFALYFFSSTIMNKAPELKYAMVDDDLWIWGSGIDQWYDDVWSWGPSSGWYALLSALILAVAAATVWLFLEGRNLRILRRIREY
jgi:hypothetical protein